MTQDLKLIVGARLRAARRAKNMTQSQLAEAVSRTVEAVSNVERGLSLPPLDVLDRAAEVLEVSLAELIAPSEADGNMQERAVLEARAGATLRALPSAYLRAAVQQLTVIADLANGSGP